MEHEIGIFALAVALPTAALLLLLLQLRANDRAAERRHADWRSGLMQLRGGAEVVVANKIGRTTPPEGVAVRAAGPLKGIDEIAAELRTPCDEPRPARDLAEAMGYLCSPADPAGLGMETGFHISGAIIYQPGPREERSILEGLAEAALEESGHEPTAPNVERLVALLTRPVAVRSASAL